MKALSALFIAIVAIAPTASIAHPGHLDDAPLAHAFVHGAFAALALVALTALAKRHGKAAWRALAGRLRTRR